ncbi:hypothetical protein MHM84_06985 [Halomonas sp. McH1-25]|uniref:hypothetical protein n=1 Tax=unclassified Halomonas TaxID=2609666 RepID=UPI001EF6A058|nr:MULTISPECIES: hypothetical protein [unclassified Halomonas]MCG7599525.1 hypothetical protein [Halomonas sp. McH1-25]MCP1343680.1 hypothetical protein [Halomonas sp. FL8]MCP1361935.1 hypothetical protein [Halomonas sp. BBD45]MCP1367037.1 hypothetical protein [Halomonas sp. BBD48]
MRQWTYAFSRILIVGHPMMHRLSDLPRYLLLVLLLAGCAGQPERPQTQRQALYGLGERAAAAAVTQPNWSVPADEVVLLLTLPEIDTELGVDTERFRETLTRALLARKDGPQVLDWTPTMADTTLPENQWLLESRLLAEGPALTLSDRELLPYRLELALRRPDDAAPHWTQIISGALDASAL